MNAKWGRGEVLTASLRSFQPKWDIGLSASADHSIRKDSAWTSLTCQRADTDLPAGRQLGRDWNQHSSTARRFRKQERRGGGGREQFVGAVLHTGLAKLTPGSTVCRNRNSQPLLTLLTFYSPYVR